MLPRRCFCVWVVLLAASGVARADTIPYRLFAVEDGLPHEEVTALAQSDDGLLWVGTRVGMAFFDGRQFHPVAFPDSMGAVSVKGLLPLSDGSVWVLAWGRGVVQVRGGQVVRTLPELADEQVFRMVVLDGILHMFAIRSFWTLAPGAAHPIEHAYRYPLLSSEEAASCAPLGPGIVDADRAPDGALWVVDRCLGPGLLEPDGSIRFAGDGLTGWLTIRFLDEHTLMLGSAAAVALFDLTTSSLTPILRSAGPFDCSAHDGVIYAASNDGVLRWHREENRVLPPLDERLGLPTDATRSLLWDREERLWVGTQAGLVHLYEPGVRHLRRIDEVPVRYAASFGAGPDGSLWGSLFGTGVVRLNPSPVRFEPEELGMIDGVDGSLYALGSAGWFRYAAERGWQRIGGHAGGIRGRVGRDGVAYFRHNDGLYRHDPADPERPTLVFPWPTADRGYHGAVLTDDEELIVRSRGTLLRGRRLDEAGWSWQFDTLAVFPRHVRDRGTRVLFDGKSKAWVSLPSVGVLLVDTRSEPPVQRLLVRGRPIWTLQSAGDSLVLAASQDGLYLFDQPTGTVRRHLTQSDGLLSNSVEAAMVFGDSLVIGHPNGITWLPMHTLSVSGDRVFLNTLLTGVERRGISVDPRAPPEFSTRDREVSFSFAAPYFAHPRQVRYYYRLSPGEEAWQETHRGLVRYTNLPPGTYHFEVRAEREGGGRGETTTYAFRIPPRFYETTWFILLGVLVLVGMGPAAYELRLRWLKRRAAQLQQLIDERTANLNEEKQKTEAQARRLDTQARKLRELDRMKTRFFANISHEFRTPLTLMLGPLEDLMARSEDPDRVAHALIHRSGRRLLGLINELLDISKLEAGKMTLHARPTDLVHATRPMIESFSSLAERHRIRLDFRTEEEPLEAFVDIDKLEKILVNLLSNAFKYTDAGGCIRVTLGRAEEHALLEVKDSGRGIPADQLPYVFDRFYQADRHGRARPVGSGIGLTLTRELVALHGGTIEVESDEGFGTTFTVRIPLGSNHLGPGQIVEDDAEEDARPPTPETFAPDLESNGATWVPDAPPGSDEPDSDRYTVLVIEDNPDVRAYIVGRLADRYAVLEAGDGLDGLDVAREHVPDLIVSDVMMPGLDGFALCRKLKTDARTSHIPVILLTARASDESRIEGIEHGADAYLAKPFNARELTARIDSLIELRRRLQETYGGSEGLVPSEVTITSADEAFLRWALTVVEEHIADARFGVFELAEEVGLSRRQLHRKLTALLDKAPLAFIRAIRMDRGRQLVEQGYGTVSEIAYAVGYNKPSTFSEHFRTAFGASPTEWAALHNDAAGS